MCATTKMLHYDTSTLQIDFVADSLHWTFNHAAEHHEKRQKS